MLSEESSSYSTHCSYELPGGSLGAGSMVLNRQNHEHSLTVNEVEFLALSFSSSHMSVNPHQLSKHENCQEVSNRLERASSEYIDESLRHIQYSAVLRRI